MKAMTHQLRLQPPAFCAELLRFDDGRWRGRWRGRRLPFFQRGIDTIASFGTLGPRNEINRNVVK